MMHIKESASVLLPPAHQVTEEGLCTHVQESAPCNPPRHLAVVQLQEGRLRYIHEGPGGLLPPLPSMRTYGLSGLLTRSCKDGVCHCLYSQDGCSSCVCPVPNILCRMSLS